MPAAPARMRDLFRRADRILSPALLFAAIYVVCFFAAAALSGSRHGTALQWMALGSVGVATAATRAVLEPGGWPIGFGGSWPRKLLETAAGAGSALLIIGACDALLRFSGAVHHRRAPYFEALPLLTLFLPAALHEELLFRGYLFQKLAAWRPDLALLSGSLLFAAAHVGNRAITPVATMNIALAGLLLSLAWMRYRRLWLPIGMHYGWNVISGQLLGYPVSGMDVPSAFYQASVRGPEWLSGGRFGIEGSLAMTGCEVIAIGILIRLLKRIEMPEPGRALKPDAAVPAPPVEGIE